MIPLNRTFYKHLEELFQHAEPGVDYIFQGSMRRYSNSRSTPAANMLRQLVKRSGQEVWPCLTNSMRYSYQIDMANHGVDEHFRSKLCDHDVDTSRNYYETQIPDHVIEKVKNLDFGV